MEEYENMKAMIQIEIEEENKEFQMADMSWQKFVWIKDLIPITSRKGISSLIHKLFLIFDGSISFL